MEVHCVEAVVWSGVTGGDILAARPFNAMSGESLDFEIGVWCAPGALGDGFSLVTERSKILSGVFGGLAMSVTITAGGFGVGKDTLEVVFGEIGFESA